MGKSLKFLKIYFLSGFEIIGIIDKVINLHRRKEKILMGELLLGE